MDSISQHEFFWSIPTRPSEQSYKEKGHWDKVGCRRKRHLVANGQSDLWQSLYSYSQNPSWMWLNGKCRREGSQKKLQELQIFSHYISVLIDYLKQIISKQLEKTSWKNSIFVILLARGFFSKQKHVFEVVS